jgi:hypothetical protein
MPIRHGRLMSLRSPFIENTASALTESRAEDTDHCSVVLSLGMYDSAEAGDHILQCLYRRRHAKSQCGGQNQLAREYIPRRCLTAC